MLAGMFIAFMPLDIGNPITVQYRVRQADSIIGCLRGLVKGGGDDLALCHWELNLLHTGPTGPLYIY
jgi:hypothetical protein